MKKLVYILAILMVSTAAFAQKTDLSGKWKLNREKSELGEQFSMAPEDIELTMDKNTLTEVRHVNWQGETITITDKFTLDGKTCENPGWMDSVKKSTATWSDDGKVLTIVTKIPMQDEEMTVTTKYNMKDGKMVINSEASSSYGVMSEVQVFDKL